MTIFSVLIGVLLCFMHHVSINIPIYSVTRIVNVYENMIMYIRIVYIM